jgi:hypothetical protein
VYKEKTAGAVEPSERRIAWRRRPAYTTGIPAPGAARHSTRTGDTTMGLRPRIKIARRARFSRCPKCNKQIRLHQKRCKTCHRALKAG